LILRQATRYTRMLFLDLLPYFSPHKNLLGSVSISTIVGLEDESALSTAASSSFGSVTLMPIPPECSAKSAKLKSYKSVCQLSKPSTFCSCIIIPNLLLLKTKTLTCNLYFKAVKKSPITNVNPPSPVKQTICLSG